MLTIALFCSENHKRLKIWLMLRIFTINDVEKNFYVYKNESKHPRGCADQGLVIINRYTYVNHIRYFRSFYLKKKLRRLFCTLLINLIFFFVSNKHIHIDSVNQTGSSASIWQQKTAYFLHCVLDSPPLNYASVVYGWALNCWNFSSITLYLPNNLQRLATLQVQKPSSPIENNLLQMWCLTVLDSSYIP